MNETQFIFYLQFIVNIFLDINIIRPDVIFIYWKRDKKSFGFYNSIKAQFIIILTSAKIIIPIN